MSLQSWLVHFMAQHARARAGQLDRVHLERYQRSREELAAALLAAQNLQVQPGQTARGSLRVQRTLQLDLQTSAGPQRSMTLDISMGGFSTMLGTQPPKGEHVTATLRMPTGEEPLVVESIVQGVNKRSGSYRVSFSFHNLSSTATERLGFLVFDAALAALKG